MIHPDSEEKEGAISKNKSRFEPLKHWIRAKKALWRELAWACGGYMVFVFVMATVLPNGLFLKPLNSWNIFHYVLGTKYFDELGYFDLYDGILLADHEGKKVFSIHKHTRDLRSYRMKSIEHALVQAKQRGIRDRFTRKRWREFKRDVASILELRKPKDWGRVIQDRGFNPSPVWLLIHEPLLNSVDIHSQTILAILCYSQMLLYCVTFALAWWAFGPQRTLLGALWFGFYFGNWGLKLGGYFSHDWFCYTICALALYKKRRYCGAGILLAYPAMMRGFCGLLALYPAVAWLKQVVRFRKPARRHTVFLFSLVLACLGLIALTGIQNRGFGVWKEWKKKIGIHAKFHRYYCWRIGLRYFFVHDYDQNSWRISLKKRMELDKQNKVPFYLGAGLLTALSLLAMVRRKENDGFILALPVIFSLFVLSRYYWSIGVLLFGWHDFDRRRIGNKLSHLFLFFVIAFYTFHRLVLKPPCRATYHYFNFALLIYFVVIVSYFLFRDGQWLWDRRKVKNRDNLPSIK